MALVFNESGLKYRIHQAGGSSGTLRMLAITTALLGTTRTLIGVEEPENYIHPGPLSAFTEHILRAEHGAQIVITTHSPQLLDVLDLPVSVGGVVGSVGCGSVIGACSTGVLPQSSSGVEKPPGIESHSIVRIIHVEKEDFRDRHGRPNMGRVGRSVLHGGRRARGRSS